MGLGLIIHGGLTSMDYQPEHPSVQIDSSSPCPTLG